MYTSKSVKQWLVGIIMGMGLWSTAQAVNPDTMVVSVTPLVTYSVSIASPMVQGYQFGNVSLGATTISTVAIVLTNNGNVSEYFSLAISNSAPGTWAPNAGAPASNQYRMMAYLNATQPIPATFVDALTTSVPGAAAALYGQASTQTNPLATKNLWLKLEMPTAITGAVVAQTMTLTVNGQAL